MLWVKSANSTISTTLEATMLEGWPTSQAEELCENKSYIKRLIIRVKKPFWTVQPSEKPCGIAILKEVNHFLQSLPQLQNCKQMTCSGFQCYVLAHRNSSNYKFLLISSFLLVNSLCSLI